MTSVLYTGTCDCGAIVPAYMEIRDYYILVTWNLHEKSYGETYRKEGWDTLGWDMTIFINSLKCGKSLYTTITAPVKLRRKCLW